MKRRNLLGLPLALAAGVGGRRAVAREPRLLPWDGASQAPPIELRTLEGGTLALSDLRGKVVLVNFWATWCEPCIEEMPSMQRLRQRLADAAFEILAVNYMEGEPRIRSFLHKVPVGFPILRDTDGAVARAWKARVFPSSFIVDGDGQLRFHLVGSIDWTSAAVETTLRSLLSGRSVREAG